MQAMCNNMRPALSVGGGGVWGHMGEGNFLKSEMLKTRRWQKLWFAEREACAFFCFQAAARN